MRVLVDEGDDVDKVLVRRIVFENAEQSSENSLSSVSISISSSR